MKNTMTQSYLKKIIKYNEDTGVFIWIVDRGYSTYAGSIAGCINTLGYRTIKIDYHPHLAHRLAWLYVYGEWPNGHIDHINHVRNDNRLANLRDVTRSENNKNVSRGVHNNKDIGVSWHIIRKKWQVYIGYKGKTKYLGLYSNKDDAIIARKNAEVELGFHINHGKPV